MTTAAPKTTAPKTPKAAVKAAPKTTEKLSDAEILAAKEKVLRRTYGRITPESIRRETDGLHAGKISVEIKCAARACGTMRRVATSDLHQVTLCIECTKEARKKRLKDKKAAVKAAKGDAKAVKSDAKGKTTKAGAPRKSRKVTPATIDVVVGVDEQPVDLDALIGSGSGGGEFATAAPIEAPVTETPAIETPVEAPVAAPVTE